MGKVNRSNRTWRRLLDTRGSAVVELALALPVLLLLLVGVVEVGRGFHAYLTVVQSTQQAAQLTLDASYTDAQIRQKVHDWSAPLVLSSVTVQRLIDRTEVSTLYVVPIDVALLRSALQRDTIRISVRAVAPKEL